MAAGSSFGRSPRPISRMPRVRTRTSEPASPNDSSVMSIERSRASANGHCGSPQLFSDVRRGLLHTFPYAVYFRASDEMVVVLGVLHLKETRRCGEDVHDSS